MPSLPSIVAAATTQQTLAAAVDIVGAPGWLALGGLLLMVTGVLVARQRRSDHAPD